jgi:hypothetical protein
VKARENPLRTERIHTIRHRPVGWTWQQFDERLEESGHRGAIVGPEGSGKTTLLEDLDRRLAARGMSTFWIRLNDQHRRIDADIPDGHVVLMDGAEQLDPSTWRRFLAESGRFDGLVITSHRVGLLLPTLVECSTTVPLLESILRDLLPPDRIAHEHVIELFDQHRGNIRLILRSLYDELSLLP